MKEDKDNHMFKHFKLHHEGDLLPPKFIMRVVTNPRTALQRQVGEAVRIRRRGGEGCILNSKSEFNRSYIPRLQLEDKEEEDKRVQEHIRIDQLIKEALDRNQDDWEE